MYFENLIVINEVYSALELKEFIDIALVSASYDKKTALYLSKGVIEALHKTTNTQLIYTVKMLADFPVTIYGEVTGALSSLAIQQQDLAALKPKSKTVFPF